MPLLHLLMIHKIKTLVPALAAFAVAPFIFAENQAPQPLTATPELSEKAPKKIEITPEQRQLFLKGLGWLVGQQSGLSQELRISKEDATAVAEGFRLALTGEGQDIPAKVMANNDAYSAFIDELQANAMAQLEAEMKAAAQENQKVGAAFIEKTKAEDKAYTTLPSGVLMKTSAVGDTDKKPTVNDTVAVRYTGKLVDGTIFDSSARDANGVPVQFVVGEGEVVELPLGQLIKAWTEAIPLLGIGGQCTLIVPADQAYGDRAAGMIPPGSTLIFDIELADIVNPEDENAPGAEEIDISEIEED